MKGSGGVYRVERGAPLPLRTLAMVCFAPAGALSMLGKHPRVLICSFIKCDIKRLILHTYHWVIDIHIRFFGGMPGIVTIFVIPHYYLRIMIFECKPSYGSSMLGINVIITVWYSVALRYDSGPWTI